jgi:hypothetical protein
MLYQLIAPYVKLSSETLTSATAYTKSAADALFVTYAYLAANYYTKSAADTLFTTYAYLAANYYDSTYINTTFASLSYLTTYYYSKSYCDLAFQRLPNGNTLPVTATGAATPTANFTYRYEIFDSGGGGVWHFWFPNISFTPTTTTPNLWFSFPYTPPIIPYLPTTIMGGTLVYDSSTGANIISAFQVSVGSGSTAFTLRFFRNPSGLSWISGTSYTIFASYFQLRNF